MDDLKEPFCATCGCSVPEVLCSRCTKWWAENPQAGDAGELVERLETELHDYTRLSRKSCEDAIATIRTLQARLDAVREEAMTECAKIALSHSNYGDIEGNKRAFRIVRDLEERATAIRERSGHKRKVMKPMAQLPYPPCQYCAGEGCVVCNLSGYDFREQSQ